MSDMFFTGAFWGTGLFAVLAALISAACAIGKRQRAALWAINTFTAMIFCNVALLLWGLLTSSDY
jgi:hypothetical protein